ncbi:hypothetical protein FKW77_006595 [Venturia effusa]|uniref:Uncharacterized protein n=1 Tax=Venturia effusa TaxID=50376 RepID=A0A517LDX8_9PEZI|nr:hypothetical protein FKW77_006595 [Venturia effusa]
MVRTDPQHDDRGVRKQVQLIDHDYDNVPVDEVTLPTVVGSELPGRGIITW